MKILPKTRPQWIRFGVISAILFVAFAIRIGLPLIGSASYSPEIGDVLFQPLPRMDLVRVIEGVTRSPYSHCGVVLKEKGAWHVIEALGSVRLTPLESWLRQGRYGKFDVYRLKREYKDSIPLFIEKLREYLGLPYDIQYMMSDEAIYCSELVYKGFQDATGEELGVLVKLGDLDWEPYVETIEKYAGGPAPLERIMITPKHLSEASQLEKVYEFSF
jgi:hypothetical protein